MFDHMDTSKKVLDGYVDRSRVTGMEVGYQESIVCSILGRRSTVLREVEHSIVYGRHL